MPSTVVHVALACLLAAALLDEHFDARAVLVVAAVVAFPDLDVFVGMVVPGTHRAAFHTLLIPVVLGAILYYDTRVRERSSVLARWGEWGARVAWVGVAAYALAAIGPDLFYNGVNLLYPVHDQFYDFSGRLYYSTQDGLVQTMVEWSEPETQSRTTGNTHYSTGVDPERGSEPEEVERIFPLAWSGMEFLLVLVGYGTVGWRLWEQRR
jgi:hypothetical protein